MFRKQDFKKVDLLGTGKKNTKIYKAEHLASGKFYAIKEVEAKTLDKLNEYKVRFSQWKSRKKLYNCSKCKRIRMCCSSMGTISMRRCTTHLGSQWSASLWNPDRTWNICLENGNSKAYFGNKKSSRRWLSVLLAHWAISRALVFLTETWNLPTCSFFRLLKSNWSTSESQKTTTKKLMTAVLERWLPSEELHNTCRLHCGKLMSKKAVRDTLSTIFSNQTCSVAASLCFSLQAWKMLQDSIKWTLKTTVSNL